MEPTDDQDRPADPRRRGAPGGVPVKSRNAEALSSEGWGGLCGAGLPAFGCPECSEGPRRRQGVHLGEKGHSRRSARVAFQPRHDRAVDPEADCTADHVSGNHATNLDGPCLLHNPPCCLSPRSNGRCRGSGSMRMRLLATVTSSIVSRAISGTWRSRPRCTRRCTCSKSPSGTRSMGLHVKSRNAEARRTYSKLCIRRLLQAGNGRWSSAPDGIAIRWRFSAALLSRS
jgi:hypothetical protein